MSLARTGALTGLGNRRAFFERGEQIVSYCARNQRRFRRADVCGRIGGEEFAVLLPDTALEDARALAEKLRREIAAEPVPFGGAMLPITVSIGVAAGSYDFDLLLSRADAAMYRAKAQGRDRVVAG